MDSRTIEEGRQELVRQPSNEPEHTHEELVINPYGYQEGSTTRRSRTDNSLYSIYECLRFKILHWEIICRIAVK